MAGDLAVGRIMMGNVVFPLVFRTMCAKSDKKRDAGLSIPENIFRMTDIPYGTDPQQKLDVYRPKEVPLNEMLPVIISIHGGGYVYGTKELYQYYCMDLAGRGFAVVNFSYRLAPKDKYPAQMEDINNCVTYCMEHTAELGIDPERVFFVGDSAGAQMVSQYVAACTNPSYAKLMRLTIPNMRILAVALNCGMYHFDPASPSTKSYLKKRVYQYGDELRVTEHITADFPPAFVMSAYGDFLLENAEPMSHFLTGIGVENELHIYGSEEHPLGHVFHLAIREPEAVLCNDEECAFFRKYL